MNPEGVDKTFSGEERRLVLECSLSVLILKFDFFFLKKKTFALHVSGRYLACVSCYRKASPRGWLKPKMILFGAIVIRSKLNPLGFCGSDWGAETGVSG